MPYPIENKIKLNIAIRPTKMNDGSNFSGDELITIAKNMGRPTVTYLLSEF